MATPILTRTCLPAASPRRQQPHAPQHQRKTDAAGGWLKNNWEYVAGGAMVAAGGVLMATGVGGP
ncbi:MAG: hypothetical protein E7L02_11800, partial [Cutibacterium avidum]|nr:hypothetical protein [Cutibacterium avidum]MDU7388208.1 hypothetical protein [Cutibacterium avidum]